MKPKAWRESEGLSIRETAKLLGISHQQLINIEDGSARVVRIDLAMKFKKVSKGKVRLHDLYEGAA